jgi:hypothetical protein
MTDVVTTRYVATKTPRRRADPLSVKGMSRKVLASRLKQSVSVPEDYEQISRTEACPVRFTYTSVSCGSGDIPLGKSVWVDFYPAGIYVLPPSGHDSKFPLSKALSIRSAHG